MTKILDSGSVFQHQFWKVLIDQTVELELLPSGAILEYTILAVDQFNIIASHDGEVHMVSKAAIARVLPLDTPVPQLLESVEKGIVKIEEKRVENQLRQEKRVKTAPYRKGPPAPYRNADEESTRRPTPQDVSAIPVVTKKRRLP